MGMMRLKRRKNIRKNIQQEEQAMSVKKMKIVDLNKLTLEELRQHRPDLVEAAQALPAGPSKESKEGKRLVEAFRVMGLNEAQVKEAIKGRS